MLQRSIDTYLESFRDLSREIWILSAVTLINRSGTMVIPFLSIYLKTVLGFSFIQVGWVMAVFGCGSLLGSYIGGRITDRLGHYDVQFWSLFLAGWFYLTLMFIHQFEHWVLAVFGLSVITDTFRPATMAAIAEYSHEGTRTRSLSLLRLAINLGWSAGPAIGGFVAGTIGYQALFILDGMTCLFAALFFRASLKRTRLSPFEGREQEQPVQTVKGPEHNRPYLLFLGLHLLVLVCFMQLFISLPIYFKEHFELTEIWIGILMALNGLTIVIFEMPLVYRLESKARQMRWIGFGAGLIGFTYLLLLLAPNWVFIVLPAMLSLSLGEIFYMPFSNSYALAQSQPENRGAYMGWYAMAGSGAFILAPIVGLQFTSVAGYTALWGMLSALCTFTVVAFLRLK